MKNKVAALVLILLMAVSPVAFAFSPFGTPFGNPFGTTFEAPSSNANVSGYEQRVVQLVNEERAKAGMDLLYMDNKISEVARLKSKDMADLNYFAHNSPTYGMAGDMLLRFGITWSFWGENIASGQDTPERVVYEWMNSPSHRENILSPNFTFIGVGYYVDSDGTPYWTQMFTSDDK